MLIRTDQREKFQCEKHDDAIVTIGEKKEDEMCIFQYNDVLSICQKCPKFPPTLKQISIDKAIQQINFTLERSLEIRKQVIKAKIEELEKLTTCIYQLETQIKKMILQIINQIEDWNHQLLVLANEPYKFRLKDELKIYFKKYHDENYLSLIERGEINKINLKFSKQIQTQFGCFHQEIETQIQNLLKKIQEEQNFPQDFINMSEFTGKQIQTMQFNYNNTLLFVGSYEKLYSIQVEDVVKKQIIYKLSDETFENLVASKKKDMFVTSFSNYFQLWYRDDNLFWKRFPTLEIHRNKIEFVALNQQETQLFVASNFESQITVLEINEQLKELIFLQYIPQFGAFKQVIMNPSQTKILINSKNIQIWKQKDKEWKLDEDFRMIGGQDNQQIIPHHINFLLNDEIFFEGAVQNGKMEKFYYLRNKNTMYTQCQSLNTIQINPFYPTACNYNKQFYLQYVQTGFLLVDQKNVRILYYEVEDFIKAQMSYDGNMVAILSKNNTQISIKRLKYD